MIVESDYGKRLARNPTRKLKEASLILRPFAVVDGDGQVLGILDHEVPE